MLSAVKIKEEPLDVIEDLQEVFEQQESLMKQQIIMDKINDELHAESSLLLNNFHIVDEQESIITISAGDMKSEDELQFIETLNKSDSSKFNGVCCKCLKIFNNRLYFLKHTKRNHCKPKLQCPVCPVTFIDTVSMLNHLKLHQENVFFCSQHCGANYKTLPLCEEHELKEHKMLIPPNICLKHYCSFCREGFKTELQLHVHWLQQNQGCGKLMQDVVIHSTNVVNNNKINFNKEQNNQLNTTNSVSAIPITKLRLKSSLAPLPTYKRQLTDEENDHELTMKRTKMFNNIKSDTESLQLPFNFETSNVEIKEEPLDEEDHMTSNLIPEIIIKTEDDIPMEASSNDELNTDSKPEMKSLLINNIMNPEFNGKIIPLTVQSVPNKMPVLNWINNYKNNDGNISNSVNTSLKNVTNLKLVKLAPASIAASNKNIKSYQISTGIQKDNQARLVPLLQFANNQNVNNANLLPLPKTGLKILKCFPNAQLMSIKTVNPTSDGNSGETKKPLIIKLQTLPTMTTQKFVQQQPIKPLIPSNPPPLVSTSVINPCAKTSPTSASISTLVSVKLNSLDHNTTIDAEDLKKLQAEALIKAEEHRKNFVIPKDRLMLIENLPEKKELIDTMKRQIAQVETNSEQQTNEYIKNSASSKGSADNFVLNNKNAPPSLYLPILTSIDGELTSARYQNPNYIFKWICPYCLKDYELKRALKSHLSRAHYLTVRDMEKINVQAKAFKKEEIIEIVPNIKEETQEEENDLQSESMLHTDSSNSSLTGNSEPIKMSAFKPSKIGYSCDKCGRKCSSKTMLNDHILGNCSREPQYQCLQCPKKFYSHSTLQCHMTIHTGELPHKCSYCDKRFRTRGQVTVHHRTHTGERPFVCQVCAQRFTHRETLIAHLSRHIGMKRYKCYGCDKHFSCISALKTHREIRVDTCGKVKFNPRAIGPRVRVIRGNVVFEAQPEINPYLKSEDPKSALSELQNQPQLEKISTKN